MGFAPRRFIVDGKFECSKCKKTKPVSEFHRNSKNHTGIQHQCKPCNIGSVTASHIKHRDRRLACRRAKYAADMQVRSDWKRKLADMLGGKCVDCGYDKHLAALEFDHINRETKAHTVSNMISQTRYSWDDCVAETLKCELRCSNCHAIRTQEQRVAAKLSGKPFQLTGPQPYKARRT